jgi:hypothetical protein
MANTTVFRPVGPTYAASISSTSISALTITPIGNDQINYCGFLNTNNFPVAVNIAPTDAAAAVLPTSGSPTKTIVLGISMPSPMVVAVPPNSFSVTAIGTSTGTIYITPMADQS